MYLIHRRFFLLPGRVSTFCLLAGSLSLSLGGTAAHGGLMPKTEAALTPDAATASLPEAPSPQSQSQTPPDASAQGSTSATQPQTTPQGQTTGNAPVDAETQIKKQEKQRILGVMPSFNTSYDQNALPLSPRQKFRLAFRSAIDPYQFGLAAIDGGIGQAQDSFSGYGQGMQGYGKRFGAAYADAFDGTMLGNALFPALLHEDPRYFRRGTGTFMRRALYAISTTVWAKRDNGSWGPNYGNILGNIAAGGISNVYYPSTDRGVGLTFERAITVTAEGTLGGFLNEFWPDIAHKFAHKQPAAPGP